MLVIPSGHRAGSARCFQAQESSAPIGRAGAASPRYRNIDSRGQCQSVTEEAIGQWPRNRHQPRAVARRGMCPTKSRYHRAQHLLQRLFLGELPAGARLGAAVQRHRSGPVEGSPDRRWPCESEPAGRSDSEGRGTIINRCHSRRHLVIHRCCSRRFASDQSEHSLRAAHLCGQLSKPWRVRDIALYRTTQSAKLRHATVRATTLRNTDVHSREKIAPHSETGWMRCSHTRSRIAGRKNMNVPPVSAYDPNAGQWPITCAMGAPMEVSSASIISRLCKAGRWRYHTAAAMNAAKGIKDPAGARNVPGSTELPEGTRSPLRSKPRRAPSTSMSHVTTMNAAESRSPTLRVDDGPSLVVRRRVSPAP